MQEFTAQPLTKQTQDNPFTNSTLLANLLMPHLEAYLSTHPDVRFLIIEYTAEHLPTVLALRRLIGSHTVKVAGILGSDRPALSKPSSASSGQDRHGEAELGSAGRLDAASDPVSPRSGGIPTTKANYLLTSSATPAEIAAFMAAIRHTLNSAASYCNADPRGLQNQVQKSGKHGMKQTILRSASIPSTPPASPRERQSSMPQSPRHLPYPALCAGSVRCSVPSITDTKDKVTRGVFLLSSPPAKRCRAPDTRTQPPPSLYPPSVLTKSDVSVEDEEWYEIEERRLMPLYMKREMGKGDDQKARKWLGLV